MLPHSNLAKTQKFRAADGPEGTKMGLFRNFAQGQRVFWVVALFSRRSQGASAMLLRSNIAKTPKFLAAPDICLAKGAKSAKMGLFLDFAGNVL
jgi:hypothetical protein